MSFLAVAHLGLAPLAGSVMLAAGIGVALAGALFTAFVVTNKGRGFNPQVFQSRFGISAPIVFAFGLAVLTIGVLIHR